MNEIWKTIVGYEEYYSVSNLGNVRRDKQSSGAVSGRILKPSKNGDGYNIVSLGNGTGNIKTHKISNLVTRAFLGKKPKGIVVNHIDGNKINDCIRNLEYVTQSQNVLHSYKLGYKSVRGSKCGSSKLKEKDIPKIRKLYPKYTQKKLAKYSV